MNDLPFREYKEVRPIEEIELEQQRIRESLDRLARYMPSDTEPAKKKKGTIDLSTIIDETPFKAPTCTPELTTDIDTMCPESLRKEHRKSRPNDIARRATTTDLSDEHISMDRPPQMIRKEIRSFKDFALDHSKPIDKNEIRTSCERALGWLSAGIACTANPEAVAFKITDNVLQDRKSLLSKIVRAGFTLIKWNIIPGSFIVDAAIMLIKEMEPPRKIEVTSPHKTKKDRDLRTKNREAFQNFYQAESLSLINRLA